MSFEIQNYVDCCVTQPHFDQACVSWYLLVSKKIRKKIQVTQNKCIRFCLKLYSRHHIGAKESLKQTGYQQKKG